MTVDAICFDDFTVATLGAGVGAKGGEVAEGGLVEESEVDVFEEEKYYDFTETPASNGMPRPCLTRQSHIPETPRKMSQVPICLDLSMDEQNELYTDADWHKFTKEMQEHYESPHANLPLDMEEGEMEETEETEDYVSIYKQLHSLKLNSYAMRAANT